MWNYNLPDRKNYSFVFFAILIFQFPAFAAIETGSSLKTLARWSDISPGISSCVAPSSASISASVTNICIGGSSLLTGTSTGGSGSYHYSWEVSETGTSGWTVIVGENLVSLNTGDLTSTRFYRFKVSTGVGCETISSALQIVVVDDPTISISGDAAVCTNGDNILTSSQAQGLGSSVYQWQISTSSGWQNISGATGSTYTTTSLGSDQSNRIILNQSVAGCSDTSLAFLNASLTPKHMP